MRRLVTWILDGLPFEPRSRRAIDETLLDWASEAGQAASIARRSVAHALGLLGVVRALAGCSVSEITRAPYGWLVPRFLLFCVPMALLMMSSGVVQFAKEGGYLGAAEIVVWALPATFIPAAAPALLLAVSWRSGERRIPAVGTAVAAALAMFVLISWVLPLSNEMFTARAGAAIARTQGTPRLAQTPHEQTLVDLVLRLDAPPETRNRAINALARIAGFSILAGATVLLGVGVSRRVRMRGLRLVVAIPAAYVLGALLGFELSVRILPRAFRDTGLVWTLVMLTLVGYVFVHRRDEFAAIENVR